MKKVEVIWRDITTSSGWHTQNQVDKFISDDKDCICQMIGYVYEEDENQLVLVDSKINVDGRVNYGTIHKIPKGCIIKMD